MNMLECLEQDKESLIRKLENANSMEHAEKMVCTELDHVLLKYNENCEQPQKREVAAYLMQALKLSMGLIHSVGETKVWEETSYSAAEKGNGSVKAKLLGGTGAVSGIFSVVCAMLTGSGETIGLSNVLLCAGLMLLAMLCTYLSGRSAVLNGKKGNGRKTEGGSGKNYRTENVIDADHIYNCLHNVLYAADQGTEQMLLMDLERVEQDDRTVQQDFLSGSVDIMAGLLEALEIEDGAYALDKIREIRYYLHKNGIDAVEYDGKNAELFDFMPSKEQRTFRPALVSEGKVLKRGLASGGMR